LKFSGKAAIVSGAGGGIGRAVALSLAVRGVRLVLVGRTREKLLETARLVQGRAGGVAEIVVGDVSDEVMRSAAIETARGRFGRLDILVNNAGNVRAGRLDKIDVADIRAMIEVDLVAPILFAREALPALRESGEAAIVNISSAIALVGVPFYATYAAVKAGLARFGEALRRELLGEDIHVLTVYPGATDIPMMATNRAGPDLGFAREAPEAVADALFSGLENCEREVIRGGEVRLAMITANRNQPAEVDERFRALKQRLEEAVAEHPTL
jgi:short-subunit dehydrogenase